jgi:hypothetical protein
VARRPVFVPSRDRPPLVQEVNVPFTWHSGFAPVQKKKNIAELHASAADGGLRHILEVSTKSNEKLGVRLSSFNLKVELPDGTVTPMECAYQGSKVFAQGGPFTDLYSVSPREAKQDTRLKTSGPLVHFKFGEEEWKLEPKTAFYDWLYLYALKDHARYLKRLFKYDAFSDIEFNPETSINTQARSCALLVALLRQELFPRAVYDKDFLISVLKQPSARDPKEGELF